MITLYFFETALKFFIVGKKLPVLVFSLPNFFCQKLRLVLEFIEYLFVFLQLFWIGCLSFSKVFIQLFFNYIDWVDYKVLYP